MSIQHQFASSTGAGWIIRHPSDTGAGSSGSRPTLVLDRPAPVRHRASGTQNEPPSWNLHDIIFFIVSLLDSLDSTLGTKQGSHDMKGDSGEMKPIEEEYDEMDGHTEQSTINRYLWLVICSLKEQDIKTNSFVVVQVHQNVCAV